uniref:Uncharacterized protein n=1 Tax=Romanomermis culicivorax TaxID=13658 RepID=A0A915J9K6_ROMCU
MRNMGKGENRNRTQKTLDILEYSEISRLYSENCRIIRRSVLDALNLVPFFTISAEWLTLSSLCSSISLPHQIGLQSITTQTKLGCTCAVERSIDKS